MSNAHDQAREVNEAAHKAAIALLAAVETVAADPENHDVIGPSGLRDLAEAYALVVRGLK